MNFKYQIFMYFKGFYPQNYYNVMFTSNLSILNYFKFSKMKKKNKLKMTLKINIKNIKQYLVNSI